MRKLILFDIDGTLLSTGGAARRAFERGLLEVYGTAGPLATHDFAGKTDPQIARELLLEAGLSDREIDAGLEELFAAYLRELALELAPPNEPPLLLPGVDELLDALDAHAHHPMVGLLTGNVAGGAETKLGAAGLAGRFRFGAFGCDSERRPDLPSIAVRRARELCGREYRGKEVVIIGDTPHDVTCGRMLGAFALGVATGGFSGEQLRAAGADAVLPDLSATDQVLASIWA